MTGANRRPVLVLDHPAAAQAAIGDHVGPTQWTKIDQHRIGLFAEATDDHQWIHVDPVRAAATGDTTIAHGFLTLSLLSHWLYELVTTPPGVTVINYGLDRVRFLSPVPAGSELRMSMVIADVKEGDGQVTIGYECIIERDNDGGRPACIARFLVRYVW